MSKSIITVSREFGSGGRTIGKMVADALGYKFYDTEIIDRVVETSGLSREIVEKYDEYAGCLYRASPRVMGKGWPVAVQRECSR